LQKYVGPKFIIPACLKKKPYNYYYDYDTIPQILSSPDETVKYY